MKCCCGLLANCCHGVVARGVGVVACLSIADTMVGDTMVGDTEVSDTVVGLLVCVVLCLEVTSF